MYSPRGNESSKVAIFIRYFDLKKSGRDCPQPDSHTARGVHPTVLPSWFHIVTVIAARCAAGSTEPGRQRKGSASLT
jgi:hypothetical protein